MRVWSVNATFTIMNTLKYCENLNNIKNCNNCQHGLHARGFDMHVPDPIEFENVIVVNSMEEEDK